MIKSCLFYRRNKVFHRISLCVLLFTAAGLEANQREGLKLLLAELAHYKIEPVVYQNFFNQFYSSIDIPNKYSTFNCPEDLEDIDCLVSLGGDGLYLMR